MAKKATNKQALGFTQDAKSAALSALGYTTFEYKGHINDAPQQIRHLVRELQQGLYLVNLVKRAIVKKLDANASGHKFTYDVASLLSEQFKEAILFELQSDYVYALKNNDGTFDFSGLLADDPSIKFRVIAELSLVKYGAGYYGVQIYNGNVTFVTHSYEVFETLLIDLAIYSPVSPFRGYATAVTSHHFTELDLVVNKFQFSGDAAITLTPAKNGKLVATVVNYPEIDGIEKLFAKAPDMLRLILELSTASLTAEKLASLQGNAQRIIGEIGT